MRLRSRLLIVLAMLLALLTGGIAAMTVGATAADNVADLSVTVSEPEDLDNPRASPPPSPGSRQVISVAARNLDSAVTATDVTLTITISDQMTVTNDVGCSTSGQTLVCDVGDIAPGQWGQVDLFVRMATPLHGVVGVSGVATSSTTDPDESNNTGSWSHDYGETDVAVTQKVNGGTPGPVGPDGAVHVVATAMNLGSKVTDIRVTLTWSEGLSYVNFDMRCDAHIEQRNAVCLFGAVEPGTGGSLEIDLKIDSGTAPVKTMAVAESGVYDPNPANNTSELSFGFSDSDPDPTADLSLANEGAAFTERKREKIVWTLTVSNAGPATADDVVLTDTLPTGVRVLDLPSICATSERTVTCRLPALAVHGVQEVQITVGIKPGVKASTFTNIAQVTASIPDPTPVGQVQATVTRSGR